MEQIYERDGDNRGAGQIHDTVPIGRPVEGNVFKAADNEKRQQRKRDNDERIATVHRHQGHYGQNENVAAHVSGIGIGQGGDESAADRQIGADEHQKQHVVTGEAIRNVEDEDEEAQDRQPHADHGKQGFFRMQAGIKVDVGQPGHGRDEAYDKQDPAALVV